MANALKKINTRTKKLQRLHPSKSWRVLHKQATREYNSGSIPKARRKKTAKKRTRARRVGSVRTTRKVVVRTFPGGNVGGNMTQAQIKSIYRRTLDKRLADLLLQHYKATTVKATKRLEKQIRKVKAELRGLS